MKFRQEQNEIFWLNVVKHDLTRHEFKVLAAFVTDAPQFKTSASIISKRTGIKKTHISRAFGGLCYQNILFKNEDNSFEICPEILEREYIPENINSTGFRKSKEAKYESGNGNFGQQAKVKKIKDEVINNNLRAMARKGKPPIKPHDTWWVFASEYEGCKVWCKAITKEDRFNVIFSKKNPAKDCPIITAPSELVKEFCIKILKINEPKDMLIYIDPRLEATFRSDHGLPRRD